MSAAPPQPFWETLTLKQMSPEQWESLCDGCGRCCLVKIEDPDEPDRVETTAVSCELLDIGTCRCGDYENRFERVPECLRMTVRAAKTVEWLPETCAYRRVAQGQGLAWWHPLVSGRPDTVHEAGISVRGFAVSELDVDDEDLWGWIL